MVRKFGAAGLGLMASLAGGVALAQSAPVAGAPGVMVVVMPGGVAVPVLPMPDPVAMLQQMQQQVAAMDQAAMQQVAMMSDAGAVSDGSAGVMVTSISNGTQSCTQRVVLPAGGGQAQVSETGNGCAALHATAPLAPVALPDAAAPKPAVPATVIAKAEPDMVVADRD
jgi:hypothetical protein